MLYVPFVVAISSLTCTSAQAASPKKHLLVLGEEKGYRHEAVSHAMATIERLGSETGLWDTTIRTDTEVLTKKKLEYNAKSLNDFDAVLFLHRRGTSHGRVAESRSALFLFMTTARGSSGCTQAPPSLSPNGRSTAR